MAGLLELIDPKSMLLSAINFVMLFFVAKYFLYRPVTKFIDQRAAKILADRKSIEDEKMLIQQQKDSQQEAYLLITAKGESEVSQRLSRADGDAKNIVAAAYGEGDKIRENAHNAALEETAMARENLRESIVSLSVEMAERILEREINAQDHALLIDEFLEKVG